MSDKRLKDIEDNVQMLLKDSIHKGNEIRALQNDLAEMQRKCKRATEETTALKAKNAELEKQVQQLTTISNNNRSDVLGLDKKLNKQTKKIGEVTKVKLILNKLILDKAQNRLQESHDAEKMQTQLDALNKDLTALSATIADHESKLTSGFAHSQTKELNGRSQSLAELSPNSKATLTKQPHLRYESFRSRGVDVKQDDGLITKRSGGFDWEWSQFIASQPLSRQCPSFSIEIIKVGHGNFVSIGVCEKNFPCDDEPGSGCGSFGYEGCEGKITVSGSEVPTPSFKCRKGDIMKVELFFSPPSCKLSKNATVVYSAPLDKQKFPSVNTLHPIVGLLDLNTDQSLIVKLLEREPWRA